MHWTHTSFNLFVLTLWGNGVNLDECHNSSDASSTPSAYKYCFLFFDWAILSDRKIALRQVNAGCASKNTALTEKVWQNPTTGPHEWNRLTPQSHPGWVSIQPKIPVVPHKAVAEVQKGKTYRRGELVWRKNGRANPLMDWKVVECFSLSVSLSLFLSVSLFRHLSTEVLAGRVRQLNAALTQCWVTSPWRRQHQCLKYEACSSPIHTQTYRLSNRLSQLNAALSPVTLVERNTCAFFMPAYAGIIISAAPKTVATVRKKTRCAAGGGSTMHCFLLGC